MNLGIQVSEILHSILLRIYPKVELLGHVILCSHFQGDATPFSTVAAPFYIPTRNLLDYGSGGQKSKIKVSAGTHSFFR